VELISSKQNRRLREFRRLSRRGREGDVIAVEGPKLAREALEAGLRPVAALVSPRLDDAAAGRDLATDLVAAGCELVWATDEVLAGCTDTRTPQGVLALFHLRTSSSAAPGIPVIVVLDGVQDPGNVGTVIRTADGAGARGVIVGPGTADPYSPKALRAAMGSTFHLPVRFSDDPSRTLGELEERGYRTVVTDAAAGDRVFDSPALGGPCALVLGSEGGGVSARVRRMAAATVHVPQLGRAESLNVAAVAAVVLYEAVRRLANGGAL